MTAGTIVGLIFLALIIWVITGNIERLFFHGRYDGSLKRGIKVWSEPLPEDVKHFLLRLSDDIVDHETGAFIRKEQNVVLIQPYNIKRARQYWYLSVSSAYFYYIGYIDLQVKEPRIQYRAPLLSFTLSFTLLAGFLVAAFVATFTEEVTFRSVLILSFLILIVGLMCYYLGHAIPRNRMLKFIEEKKRSGR